MPRLHVMMRRVPKLVEEFIPSWNLAKLFILIDALITYLVIKHVRYTEIDWSTYIVQIEGPTGPLVYPAGHLYIFLLLRELTDGGKDILAAQYTYWIIYIAQLILVYKIYSHKKVQKVPPYVFGIMCLASYRIHSIYVLRLFNDPIAILFAYASFYAVLRKKHTISAVLFSIAVSIKMNILLFAPAYALIFYEDIGLLRSMKNAAISMSIQIILAAPFLYTDPIAYFKRSFNFGRVFLHQWTVNWRFLDESVFTSSQFFRILILGHILVLFMIFYRRWINAATFGKFNIITKRDDPILTLFITNLIGVAFSRSLHYQFYIWYYHSLPMVLWATRYSVVTKLLILGLIEFSWNSYPSTTASSLILHSSHLAILIGLFARQFFKPVNNTENFSAKPTKKRNKHSIKRH